MTNIVRIFTDGSAIGNPGPGGWGAVVIEGKKRREMSGAYPWTNISEMELLAAVEVLRSIPTGSRIELYSDSERLIHGMCCPEHKAPTRNSCEIVFRICTGDDPLRWRLRWRSERYHRRPRDDAF